MGRYGWKPDKPDARDLHYSAPLRLGLSLPPFVDQRPNHPPIVDQGQLGSCTANAGVDIVEYLIKNDLHVQAQEPWAPLSRLGLYYDERVIEGSVNQDSGAEIRDTLKVIAQNGVGLESLCPYDINAFTTKPSAAYYADAAKRQGLLYARVAQTECSFKGVLAQGLPIILGFTVYTSFESDAVAQSGQVPMPDLSRESVLGGHAVVVIGYDDATRRWLARNSWGILWGLAGHFTIPYEYFLNPDLSSDSWCLQSVK